MLAAQLARAFAPLAAVALLARAAAAQQAAPCSVTVSGETVAGQQLTETLSFQQCLPIPDIGNNFILAWSIQANNASGVLTTFALAADAGGYVAFGLPSEPEEMVGATAFTVQACDACSSGAEVVQYYLGGTASGQVNPAKTYHLGTVNAGSNGTVQAGHFTINLPAGSAAAPLPLIFAAGNVYADGYLRQHASYGYGSVSLTSGALTGFSSSSSSVNTLVTAHAWLQAIGWGVLIPTGIIIAHSHRTPTGLWFKIHRVIQPLGLVLGIAGLALGFVVGGGWSVRFVSHRNIGVAATILGLLQVSAFFRPHTWSKHRRAWNLLHWSVGLSAAVLAIANIYYGLADMINKNWAWITYTVVLGIIAASGLVKDSHQYLQLPPPEEPPVGKDEELNGGAARASENPPSPRLVGVFGVQHPSSPRESVAQL